MRIDQALLLLLGASALVALGMTTGWQGPAIVVAVAFLLAIAAGLFGLIGSSAHQHGWAMLSTVADAVASGAPVPSPEQWEPWLLGMAGHRERYEREIYERAADVTHAFREPFQRLLCGFATARARELALAHLQANPGDLVAPQLAAYLIARGTLEAHGAAVAATLQACPPDELADPAAALLSRVMESRDDAGGWPAFAATHASVLRPALEEDEQLRWDAALGGEG